MSRDYGDGIGCVTGVIAVIGVIVVVVVAIFVGDNRPRSTVGVETIDNQTAQISKGDTLVLTSSCGKSCSHTWLVTWDGQETVFVDDHGGFAPQHHTGTTCGIDCPAKVDMGWLTSSIDITERANETVEVHWSWLWGYRKYEVSQ